MPEERTSSAPARGTGTSGGLDGLSLASLEGSRILVVEDEAIIAVDIEFALEDLGAEVIGPAGTLPDALTLAENTPEIDGAILDVNLAGESVFLLADHLVSRSVPMVFHTGVDVVTVLERRFPEAEYLQKPVQLDDLLRRLAQRLA